MAKNQAEKAVATINGSAPQKRSKLNFAAKNAIAGYLFISPFIIGFLAFLVVPMIESIRMVFSAVTLGGQKAGFTLDFIGLANIDKAFNVDPDFTKNLVDELLRMALVVPATIIFAFFVAILLNQKFRGRGVVRSIFFLPVILSAGIMVGLEANNILLQGMGDIIQESNSMASSVTGVLEDILISSAGSGAVEDLFFYVLDIVNRVYDIAIGSGIQIIIFLSGLQTISPSMYEASRMEGATEWEGFWKITFPMISSLILVNVVYTVIDYFVRTDNQVMTQISEVVVEMDYGFATAMAWSYFLIVIAVVGVLSFIISKGVYYYE